MKSRSPTNTPIVDNIIPTTARFLFVDFKPFMPKTNPINPAKPITGYTISVIKIPKKPCQIFGALGLEEPREIEPINKKVNIIIMINTHSGIKLIIPSQNEAIAFPFGSGFGC